METGKKRLEFYGGAGVSLLPFVIFIITIIITTFVWGSISDGALWVPAFLALLIPFFLSKDKSSIHRLLSRVWQVKNALFLSYAGYLQECSQGF